MPQKPGHRVSMPELDGKATDTLTLLSPAATTTAPHVSSLSIEPASEARRALHDDKRAEAVEAPSRLPEPGQATEHHEYRTRTVCHQGGPRRRTRRLARLPAIPGARWHAERARDTRGHGLGRPRTQPLARTDRRVLQVVCAPGPTSGSLLRESGVLLLRPSQVRPESPGRTKGTGVCERHLRRALDARPRDGSFARVAGSVHLVAPGSEARHHRPAWMGSTGSSQRQTRTTGSGRRTSGTTSPGSTSRYKRMQDHLESPSRRSGRTRRREARSSSINRLARAGRRRCGRRGPSRSRARRRPRRGAPRWGRSRGRTPGRGCGS